MLAQYIAKALPRHFGWAAARYQVRKFTPTFPLSPLRNNSRWRCGPHPLQKVPVALQRYPNELAASTHFSLRKQLLQSVLDHTLGDV